MNIFEREKLLKNTQKRVLECTKEPIKNIDLLNKLKNEGYLYYNIRASILFLLRDGYIKDTDEGYVHDQA